MRKVREIEISDLKIILRVRRVEDEEGKTSGRKDRLRGHMGVRTMALRDGCTIGPPAESEYAVEPVGVDTMRPSDWCPSGESHPTRHRATVDE